MTRHKDLKNSPETSAMDIHRCCLTVDVFSLPPIQLFFLDSFVSLLRYRPSQTMELLFISRACIMNEPYPSAYGLFLIFFPLISHIFLPGFGLRGGWPWRQWDILYYITRQCSSASSPFAGHGLGGGEIAWE